MPKNPFKKLRDPRTRVKLASLAMFFGGGYLIYGVGTLSDANAAGSLLIILVGFVLWMSGRLWRRMETHFMSKRELEEFQVSDRQVEVIAQLTEALAGTRPTRVGLFLLIFSDADSKATEAAEVEIRMVINTERGAPELMLQAARDAIDGMEKAEKEDAARHAARRAAKLN